MFPINAFAALWRDSYLMSVDANYVVWRRMLLTPAALAARDPWGEAEMHRMVEEKSTAAVHGAIDGGFAFWKAAMMTGLGVFHPTGVGSMLDIPRAAMAPASARVRSNRRRLSKRSVS